MTSYSGFLIIFDEDQRSEWLQEIGRYRGMFSDALSASDWRFKDIEICLLSFGGQSIDVACLGKRGKNVASAKYRVDFSTFVELNSLSLTEIERKLNSTLRQHFVRSASGRGQRVPPTTWHELINILKEMRPQSAEAIENLTRLREASGRKFVGVAAEVIAQERDAFGVALDIFDQTNELRKRALSRWAPPPDSLPPFMEGVEAVRLTEEQMLAHDANLFSDAPSEPTVYGRRFVVSGRVLDVIYQNRTKVEKTLGVDMVYYNDDFGAYTLVQYKRMADEVIYKGKPKTAVFRPNSDSNFSSELKRMETFRQCVPDEWGPAKEWRSYRLNGDGFFFKFCPALTLEIMSSDLIRGMYLPREYVEALLLSNLTNGERNGKLLAYENVQRHLSNTDFTKMVSHGWIGTRGVSTERITAIVRDALSEGRAVIQAWSAKSEEVESE